MFHSFGVIALALLAALPIQQAMAQEQGSQANCRAITDNAKRLACYDGLVQAAPSAAPAVSSPQAPAPASPPSIAPAPPAPTPAVSTPAPTGSHSQAPTQPDLTGIVPTPAAPTGFGAETVVRPVDPNAGQSIVAHVVGSIDGIKRQTIFVLDNGQTWQSVDDHEYDFEGRNPAVTVTRNFAGSYWLRLAGGYFNLRVTRIK
jgi:hypothetical protein